MTRTVAVFTACLALACGCTPQKGEQYVPPELASSRSPGEDMRQPSEEELRSLLTLSELVVVGRVIERRNAPEGENYHVDVQEVLASRGERLVGAGERIRVSTFFFRQGKPMAKIGKLRQPNRYLFFLSPMERKGWWLHLDDTAGYRLPDAEETLRTLRALRPAPSKDE